MLVERAPQLRTGGYIIDFWGRGFDVAEKMGLAPALRQAGYEIDEVRFVNGQGRKTGGFSARVLEPVIGDRYVSILRSDLARLLYDALGGRIRTIFGNCVTAIEQDASGVNVTFTNAPPESFDLVIGTDGLHSQVRTLVFGRESNFEHHLGYSAASFTVPDYPRRDPRAYVSYSAPGRQVSRYALRDGATVFFFVFASTPDILNATPDMQSQKQTLRRVFAGDGWECPAILDLLDHCTDLYFDRVSQIRMPRWSENRVALAGDACFCPSLLAGQGAALAMTASYLLAGELTKADGDFRAAFRSYEAMLHPLMDRKQRGAAGFAASFAPRTNFGIFLRNRISALFASPFVLRLFMRGLIEDDLVLPGYVK